MNLIIKNLSIKEPLLYNIEVHPYQSFHSILYSLNQINDDEKEFYYFSINNNNNNKIKIDLNLSPDHYDLKNNSEVELNRILPGGGISQFFNLIKKHPIVTILCLLVALLPLVYLPLGLIPITSSLLKIIFDQSFEKIGVYLATHLGKYSLYNRLKIFSNIFKLIVFILIVYVSFTFPLLILCLTLKGSFFGNSSKLLCSPYNAANITGLILTVLYLIIYNSYRSTEKNLDWLKSIFQKNQYTDATLAPMTEGFKKVYRDVKYLSMMKNPIIGVYFNFLDKAADTSTALINTLIKFGCEVPSEANFNKTFSKQINELNSMEDKKEMKIKVETSKDNTCCNPENYFSIGSLLYKFINSPITTQKLKESSMYSSCILLAISFLENAQNVPDLSESKNEDIKDLLFKLEQRLEMYAQEQNIDYVPSNHGSTNAFIKTFLFYSICNVFTLSKNTSVTIQEMGSIYEVIDMLKSGSSTGSWLAYFYFICFIALFICGLFDIY